MKTRMWAVCVIASVVLQILAIPASAQNFSVKYGPDKFANISYPAVGKAKVEEGTCEGWFKIGYLPGRKVDITFFSPMTFFCVGGGRNIKFAVQAVNRYTKSLDRHTSQVWASGIITGRGFGIDITAISNWQTDTWHYVAFTWKMDGEKYDNKLYIDGKEVARQVTAPNASAVITPQDVLRVGATYFNSSYGTVDEIKVSTVARSAEEIAKSFSAGFTRDRFTSILDKFESLKAVGKVSETSSVEGVNGIVAGTFKEVAGRKQGSKALQLHVVEE